MLLVVLLLGRQREIYEKINCLKRILTILMLVGALLDVSAVAPTGFFHKRKSLRARQDSVSRNIIREGDRTLRRKMSHSAYPVELKVVGNAVRVDSPDNQILPIYTHNGTFYLIMRLNKGTNWLNGLPKGRYFINNRLVIIK